MSRSKAIGSIIQHHIVPIEIILHYIVQINHIICITVDGIVVLTQIIQCCIIVSAKSQSKYTSDNWNFVMWMPMRRRCYSRNRTVVDSVVMMWTWRRLVVTYTMRRSRLVVTYTMRRSRLVIGIVTRSCVIRSSIVVRSNVVAWARILLWSVIIGTIVGNFFLLSVIVTIIYFRLLRVAI